MLAKFQGNRISIIMLSINCLNSSVCSSKQYIKNVFMEEMVNNIQLAWKLACILKTYRICNPMVRFPKYEFNNKLLGGVTLLRVTLGVTWTKPIYIYIYKRILNMAMHG